MNRNVQELNWHLPSNPDFRCAPANSPVYAVARAMVTCFSQIRLPSIRRSCTVLRQLRRPWKTHKGNRSSCWGHFAKPKKTSTGPVREAEYRKPASTHNGFVRLTRTGVACVQRIGYAVALTAGQLASGFLVPAMLRTDSSSSSSSTNSSSTCSSPSSSNPSRESSSASSSQPAPMAARANLQPGPQHTSHNQPSSCHGHPAHRPPVQTNFATIRFDRHSAHFAGENLYARHPASLRTWP